MTFFAQDFVSDSTVTNFNKILERSFSTNDDRSMRVPFYLTSTYRQKLKVSGVSMLMNPSSISFKQAKRITKKQTQGGAIFLHWANRSGRNNDILELECSGQTGNINIQMGTVGTGITGQLPTTGPVGWVNDLAKKSTNADSLNPSVLLQGSDYSVSGAAKIAAFWNLYQLTREPVVDPRTGAPIYYYFSYSSQVLGNTFVTFIGHFNKVLDFTDDATNPNSKNYSFGFTVLASIPSLDYIYNTVVSNLRNVVLNPL